MICILSNKDESRIWNMIVAHIYMDHLNKLIREDLVIDLSNLWLEKYGLCDACQNGK